IDGIGSEVALMAFVAPDHFLWASDYIQTTREPALYTCEVWSAAQREGVHPEKVAAEHLPLTPWAKIDELADAAESAVCHAGTSHAIRIPAALGNPPAS